MVVAYTLLVVPMIAKKPQKTRQAFLIPFEKKISRTKMDQFVPWKGWKLKPNFISMMT